MQIAIDLPNDFITFQSATDIQQEVQSVAVSKQRVTLAKAAELAKINLYDFMTLCKTNNIPIINITRDELLEELAGFNL